MPDVTVESIYTPVPSAPGARLHLKRFFSGERGDGPAVFLLHGAIENGRIFYSDSGKGFAPYLAQQGYDVFVGDLRGRGDSTPPIARGAAYGQTDAIVEELPAMLERVREAKGEPPRFWGSHSWGGVLLLSLLARHPALATELQGLFFFGTKRTINVFNAEVALKIHFFWNRYARVLVRRHGYLPAKERGYGSDNETDLSHLHSKLWVKAGSPWVDPVDGFDYGARLRQTKLPPALFLAGQNDRCLGNPYDVRQLILESGYGSPETGSRFDLRILGKRFGNLRDYGHVDMLTDPEAPKDHFPKVIQWMKANS